MLTPFLFENGSARGAIVDIRDGVAALLGARDYAPDVRRLVAQACAAAPLLATHLKFEGRINLQFQGGEALKLLVAQVDHRLNVRGMAKADEDARGDFAALTEGGVLALMHEPLRGGQPYQAMVPMQGGALSAALEHYFEQSEQLPTLLRVAVSDERLAGFMLQRVPGHDAAADQDYWQHLGVLAQTLSDGELLDCDAETLLHRLFHAEDLRVFEARPVQLACNCSRGSISALLLSLGEDELAPALASEGQVEVVCEFCGRAYQYTPSEISELFAAAKAEPTNEPKH